MVHVKEEHEIIQAKAAARGPLTALTQNRVRDLLLLGLELQNPVFNAPRDTDSIHLDGSGLTKAVDPVDGLVLNRRIPPLLKRV